MKRLFEIGETPPLGEVPEQMYASMIRPERFGEPKDAYRIEVVDIPKVGRGQVLVLVMAAGLNYNGVWAAAGQPVDVIGARGDEFHIGGSDGSGVVWAVGEGVENTSVGDHVILSCCRWDESAPDIRLGVEPMMSATQSVWGYEANFGSFAQFTVVEEYQCHPKPAHLTWEQAACFLVTGATAYRQLFGWPPHTVKPGDPVLIWGGAGGLGSMAIQLVSAHGGIPIAVVSDEQRARHCLDLGAKGVIDRTEFDHWGRLPDIPNTEDMAVWTKSVKRFGKRIWEIVGERRSPSIVLEHSGQSTIPTSMYLCATGGMVVICGGTTGYHADVDLRFLWMRQKRLQGSHYASIRDCRDVIALVGAGKIDPCLSWCGTMADIGKGHQLMHDNAQSPGNIAVTVNAASPGLTTLDV